MFYAGVSDRSVSFLLPGWLSSSRVARGGPTRLPRGVGRTVREELGGVVTEVSAQSSAVT